MKLLKSILMASLFLSFLTVHAEEAPVTADEAETQEEAQSAYVLMNIPYASFYAEEGDNDVDAVSSATMNKPRTGTLAGGSYHVNSDGSDITGVIYPVYVSDLNVLENNGYTEITDESEVTITVTNRGKETTTTYTGRDALFEAPSYSYYVLGDDEIPDVYKTADFSGDVPAFSAVNKTARTVEGATATLKFNTRHADVEISLSLPEGIEQGQAVSGVVVTTDDGEQYGLRHIANIWRATELGWNFAENDIYGKTITNIRYYTQDDVIDYPVSIKVKKTYVLMNIPYASFYEAEGDNDVDAVSSATMNKPRTGTLAGGSYHVNSDGSDITGVIYPVYVSDLNVLENNGYTEITDESEVTITVTNRGKETTTTYTGRDALFEAPSYSYYVLGDDEEPSCYKNADFSGGEPVFSAVNKEARTVEGATGTVKFNTRHADVEISLSLPEGIAQGQAVSGVVVTTDDGEQYGLRHIVNIWRATELGWSFDENDIYGKTITNIRYYTQDDVIDYPVQITVKYAYVLMNIPYASFYEAEGDSEVDAVSSATMNKPRTGTLAGGSYHVNSDGSDITGVIYPVYVADINALTAKGYTEITDESEVTITVTNRGKETTTTYTGRDALFEAPSYAYYVLGDDEIPDVYKTADFSGDVPVFSAVNKEARTVEGATGTVKFNTRHADVEISLSLPEGIEQGQAVSGVVVTTDDGEQYGLRHIVNIWRATELGWSFEENDIYGKTITNIRYYTQDDVIDYPVEIDVIQIEITASASGAQQVLIEGLPEDIINAKATITYTEAEEETASLFFTAVYADEVIAVAEDAEINDGLVDLNQEMIDGTTYDVSVVSDNYSVLPTSFVYSVDKTQINTDITAAEGLKESDYTADSWKNLQEALKEAKTTVGKDGLTQSVVDAADEKLAAAIKALVKADGTANTSDSGSGHGFAALLLISLITAAAALKFRFAKNG